jgi:hypothetical protein
MILRIHCKFFTSASFIGVASAQGGGALFGTIPDFLRLKICKVGTYPYNMTH